MGEVRPGQVHDGCGGRLLGMGPARAVCSDPAGRASWLPHAAHHTVGCWVCRLLADAVSTERCCETSVNGLGTEDDSTLLTSPPARAQTPSCHGRSCDNASLLPPAAHHTDSDGAARQPALDAERRRASPDADRCRKRS